MFKFICSCGDDRDAAKMLQKWDVFNNSVIGVGDGYLGSNAFIAATIPYTQVRCVKRVTLSPANQVLYGIRLYLPADALPFSGFSYYVVSALHFAGLGSFSNSTKQISVNSTADGKLYLARGNYNGTVLATSADPVLVNDGWVFIEVLATIASSGGTITVMAEGETVLTYTGNTQALGGSTIDGVEIITNTLDDFYICDLTAPNNFFIGPRYHVIAKGMSAGYWDEWTPQGATNLQTIDDPTPDGVYNVALGVGLTDLFTPYPIAEEEADEILALQNNLTAYKGSVLSAYKVADVVQISGVDYVGPDLDPPAASPRDLLTIREFQPSGAAWTRTVYNASKRGYRKTA